MRMGFLADKLIGAPRENIWRLPLTFLLFVSSGCDGIRRYFHYKADHDPKTASLQVPMAYVYVIVPVTECWIMIFSLNECQEWAHKEFKEKRRGSVMTIAVACGLIILVLL